LQRAWLRAAIYIPTNITRRSPHSGHGGARPRAPFNSVKPNIDEYKRTKCGRIDLVRSHLIRYRTHIQHTRANKYSYPSAVVPAPSTPPPRHYCLPHAVGRSFRLTHPLLAYPRAQAGFSSVATPSCHLRTRNARACGRRDIDKHHSRITTSRTRQRTTRVTSFGCSGRENTTTRAPRSGVVRV